jgi:hypothetical protein
MLRRLLDRHGVAFVWSGRARLVALSEIRARIPPLWESLVALVELRALAEKRADGSRGYSAGMNHQRPPRTRAPQG